MEKQNLILLLKSNVQSAIFNFECGGDSFESYDAIINYNKFSNYSSNEESSSTDCDDNVDLLKSIIIENVFSNVEFYEAEGDVYYGEVGKVNVNLISNDENILNETDFSLLSDSEIYDLIEKYDIYVDYDKISNDIHYITETINLIVPISESVSKLLNDFIKSISFESYYSGCDIIYKNDFIYVNRNKRIIRISLRI